MSIRISAYLIAVSSVIAATVMAAGPEEGTERPRTPPGHFMVHDELWDSLADEPGQHMERAREAFLEVDSHEAATELRKAATYLRISAGQAVADSERALIRSAHELETLARRIEQGAVKSVGELDSASARALHALSHHHCILAERSWLAHQTDVAGKRLQHAADQLERATARTNQTLRAATNAVVKETRIIAGKLVEGTGYAVDEIGSGFTKLGKQAEAVGKGIEPPQTEAPNPN